jgi:pimeloyl-ACP methyl ester carboxylesterase
MHEQQGLAAVNGTRLYYEVAGEGQPLVLVHGFTLDTRMWDAQFEPLAHHYRVIRYDLRGFGKSALPTGESYAHYDDLKALLDHLGIAQAYLLGLSLGGAITLELTLAHPEITRALILVDTVLWGFHWSAKQSAEDAAIWTTARQSGVQAAKDLWLDHSLFGPARKNPAVASRLAQIVSDYSGWHLVHSDPGRVPDPPAARRLDQIRAPTLVIVGERDLPDFRRIADTCEQQIVNARKVILPGVGHMSNMEAADKFNETVLGFLANIEPGAP